MKLDDALQGVSKLAFDTSPIIYFVEVNPAYDPLVSNIFHRVEAGNFEGWTSVITLSEVLVQPITKGRADLQKAYRDLLLGSYNFYTASITSSVAERAATVRASYGLRLPDAIQIAFALDVGCQALLTNDRSMIRVKDLSVLVLDDLET